MAQAQKKDPTWVTLRVAAAEAGVSISALRKWYRGDKIRSKMTNGPNGPTRLVALEDVVERASQFQTVEGMSVPSSQAVEAAEAVAARGVLVPRDAWEQMMAQLGNLHLAGQEMATARERAAKAETTVDFLKERVAILRGELESTQAALERARTESGAKRFRRRA